MKFTIGITTYNRLDTLKRMSASLIATTNVEQCNIRIYDDRSSDFSIIELEEIFPTAAEIILREKNLGADKNMRQMFVDFLNTDDEYLFIADADLIFHPEWFNFFLKHKVCDILSLYNSSLHDREKAVPIAEDVLIKKQHIGAAGAIIKRKIVELIINNVPPSRAYDWDWSNFLSKMGYPLFVSNRSYVQHIGVIGTNNDTLAPLDFGLNFLSGSLANELNLIKFFQDAIISKDTFISGNFLLLLYRKSRSFFKLAKWYLKNYRK